MEPEKKSHGALIGSIIIIVLLIIGGIYIWQLKIEAVQKQNAENKIQAENTQTQTNETTALNIKQLNSLEQDINSTDTNTGVNINKIQ